MLDELIAQAERGIPVENVAGVISALIDIGDHLWLRSDDERQTLGVDNPDRIVALVGELLRRVPDADRFALLADAVQRAGSLATPVMIVRRLEGGFGISGEQSARTASITPQQADNGLVTVDDAQRLEDIACERIRQGGSDGQVYRIERPLWLLARWAAWAGTAEVGAWIDSVRADNSALAELLLACRSARGSETSVMYRLNPAWFDSYVNRDALAAEVERLLGAAEHDTVREVAKQFMAEYKALADGLNPDDLSNREIAQFRAGRYRG